MVIFFVFLGLDWSHEGHGGHSIEYIGWTSNGFGAFGFFSSI
jgi:hypothetical protein